MVKKVEKEFIWKILEDSKVILLTTHVHPDGDGIASELALSSILISLGKEVYIVNQDRTPEIYNWLPGAEKIISLEQNPSINLQETDLIVLLDCGSSDRIGKVYDIIKNSKLIISIDHHENSACLGDYCYINPEASSIGEVLYSTIPDINRFLNKEIATCIYVSILTDTGSFAFSNTTAKVFEIAAKLVRCGADPDNIFQRIYYNRSIYHFRLLSRALQLMKTDSTGKVCYTILPRSVYVETGAGDEDNEGILEVMRGLKNVQLIILIRQLKDGKVKTSLRSKNNIDCNYLAGMFGGGGHRKSSGFVIEGDITTAGEFIINTILEKARKIGWI